MNLAPSRLFLYGQIWLSLIWFFKRAEIAASIVSHAGDLFGGPPGDTKAMHGRMDVIRAEHAPRCARFVCPGDVGGSMLGGVRGRRDKRAHIKTVSAAQLVRLVIVVQHTNICIRGR